VALIRTDVSEDRIASIFRVHECELFTGRSCKLLYRHRLVEDDNHHSHRRGNLKSYILYPVWVLKTLFSLLHFFIYDFTSRHYSLCLQYTRTLWRCVSERSWFLFGSAVWIFLDLRLWSLFSSMSLFSVCVSSLLCVRLSAAPQRVCLLLGKKTPPPMVSFPVAAVSNTLVAKEFLAVE
jgi:hypothetical protein